MKSLEMLGPYPYNADTINSLIQEGIKGNYALGFIEESDNSFVVHYVGRSDDDLRTRIKHSIGRYSHFKFSQADSISDAYFKECKNWHDFGGEEKILDNKIHPDRPDNMFIVCPYCISKSVLDRIRSLK